MGTGDADFRAFHARLEKSLGTGGVLEFAVEPHIVGVAVRLRYEGGDLRYASLMEGPGQKDVTANMKTILSVPLTLVPLTGDVPIPQLLEVQAKVYMELKAFEGLNRERARAGLTPFENPRSAALEAICEQDPRATAKRPLEMFCSGTGEVRGLSARTHVEMMIALQVLGLRVNRPHMKGCGGPQEVLEYCRQLDQKRSQFPYPIDGALIQVNDLALRERLGERARGPGWEVVCRF